MPQYFQLYGRVFEVHSEPDQAAANAFMEANEGYALLAQLEGGECLLAPADHQGVPVAEVPAKIMNQVRTS
jgi:hypothetical protein